MACQGFTNFLGTKYSDFLQFQQQCSFSVLYDKQTIYYLYDYLETSKSPTTLITDTPSTDNHSPHIAMSDFTILEQTPPNKDPTNSLANTTSVIGATIAHKQLTMDITIYSLTRKYHDDCEWTGQLLKNRITFYTTPYPSTNATI